MCIASTDLLCKHNKKTWWIHILIALKKNVKSIKWVHKIYNDIQLHITPKCYLSNYLIHIRKEYMVKLLYDALSDCIDPSICENSNIYNHNIKEQTLLISQEI